MATTLTVDNWALDELTLDFANQSIPDIFIANANDMNGRGIDLYVTQDGQALSMTGMSVYLVWSHDNGNQDLTKFTAVSSQSGHFRVLYPAGMCHAGNVLARIQIVVSSTRVTGSRDFQICVERNPIDPDAAMADESWNLFVETIAELNTLERKVESAEATRVSNEETRESNETARQNAEASRVEAENARVQAEKDREQAASKAISDFNTKADAALEEVAQATTDAEQAASKATAATNDLYELIAHSGTDTETQAQIDAIGTALAEATDEFYLIGTTIYAPSSKASISGSTVSLPSSSYSGSTITLS